jgi:exodeoxyribonuclease VII large subunit
LLDRGMRAVDVALGRRRVVLDTAAAALPQLATSRLRWARSELDAAAAALGVLDPQRTLERGYAIVRRATDGAIVRAPREAPPATPLRLRVAEGEIAARVDAPE